MRSPHDFADIDTWVFDLDNTLYPHHVNLWQQVDARINEFVASWLNVSSEHRPTSRPAPLATADCSRGSDQPQTCGFLDLLRGARVIP